MVVDATGARKDDPAVPVEIAMRMPLLALSARPLFPNVRAESYHGGSGRRGVQLVTVSHLPRHEKRVKSAGRRTEDRGERNHHGGMRGLLTEIFLRIARAFSFSPVRASWAMGKEIVLVSDILEEVDLVFALEETNGNGMHHGVSPTLKKRI